MTPYRYLYLRGMGRTPLERILQLDRDDALAPPRTLPIERAALSLLCHRICTSVPQTFDLTTSSSGEIGKWRRWLPIAMTRPRGERGLSFQTRQRARAGDRGVVACGGPLLRLAASHPYRLCRRRPPPRVAARAKDGYRGADAGDVAVRGRMR